MSEKIFIELWYDHTVQTTIDGMEIIDGYQNVGWKTRIWIRIYEIEGSPLGGVAVRLYATLLSAPPCEEEVVLNDIELGSVISRDNGETEPILSRLYSHGGDLSFGKYDIPFFCDRPGGLLVEAVAYDHPLYNEQSFWYVPFKVPDLRPYTGEPIEAGWRIYSHDNKRQRFYGPPKKPWKALRQWKIEETRKAKIEDAVKEIENHLTVKSLQSYDGLLVNLSEMGTATEQIEADFAERAFAPFWDSICGFAVKIGRLETEMRSMAQYYREYKELCEQYLKIPNLREGDAQPSPFREEWLNPVDPKMLKQITDWFRAAVRKGQTDFQFASIYEHYRTRDVLVEGFRDLVKKFTDISHALDSVNRNLINGFRELRECVGELQEYIGDEFDYLRTCIEEEEEITRQVIKKEQETTQQVIKDEGQSNRQLIIASTAASEILSQKRHNELLDSYEYEQEKTRSALENEFEYLRDSIEEEGESAREFAEEVEDRRQERQRELLTIYEYEQDLMRETLTDGLERNEAGQQDRHDEVIVEGKRDRELIRDIDRQLGGKEWYKS